MTIYDEICAAFRETLPRRLALSKAIEDLPSRLRTALSDALEAPNGSVEWLSDMHSRAVPYVYLARPVATENGQRKWEPSPNQHDLSRDDDGVLWFGLGLALVCPDMAPYFIHFAVCIEDIREDSVKLVIVGAPGAIELKLGAPESYALAAQKIADWLQTSQADPRAALGESTPVGFRS